MGVPIKRALSFELWCVRCFTFGAAWRRRTAEAFNLMHTWPPPIKSGRLGIYQTLYVAIEKVCAYIRDLTALIT